MKYTPATIAKSLVAGAIAFIGAATAGAHGGDLSSLDVGSWLFALGSGFTAAGAVFAAPNKQQPTGDVEPAPPIADVAIDAFQQTVQNATHGAAELDRVKQAVTDFMSGWFNGSPQPPAVGPLADDVIRTVLPPDLSP